MANSDLSLLLTANFAAYNLPTHFSGRIPVPPTTWLFNSDPWKKWELAVLETAMEFGICVGVVAKALGRDSAVTAHKFLDDAADVEPVPRWIGGIYTLPNPSECWGGAFDPTIGTYCNRRDYLQTLLNNIWGCELSEQAEIRHFTLEIKYCLKTPTLALPAEYPVTAPAVVEVPTTTETGGHMTKIEYRLFTGECQIDTLTFDQLLLVKAELEAAKSKYQPYAGAPFADKELVAIEESLKTLDDYLKSPDCHLNK